jgi:hypothetical protein
MLFDFNIRRRDSAGHGNFVSWSKTAAAHVAQLVEHVLGKDEVTGSIPVMGSMLRNYPDDLRLRHEQQE